MAGELQRIWIINLRGRIRHFQTPPYNYARHYSDKAIVVYKNITTL